MKLYDSLTNQKNQLLTKKVNIYSCGPTVYNHIHLGNARPVILMDVLIRYLLSQGYKPNWVQNITDIDDKIINQALTTNQTEKTISQKYLKSYLEDLKGLNIQLPQTMPLISEYLPQIITYIQKLITSGHAYESNGNVFFDVAKTKKNYGKLSNQKIDQLQVSESPEKKKSNLDFALWKRTDHGKKWNSPWGLGRPGWHTECVVLINSHFKNQSINIHAGGIDLQFPHHENERVQHLALTGQELAETWLHNGHLIFNNEKMSKSLGNVILVKDFLRQYDGDLLRWIFLTTNYRQPLNFTDDLIKQGITFFRKVSNLRKKMIYYLQVEENKKLKTINKLNQKTLIKFNQAMDDNLNTPQVLSLLEELMTKINLNLTKKEAQNAYQNYYDLNYFLKNLGFRNHLETKLSLSEIKIYQKWLQATKDQNFEIADKYREQLKVKDLI